MKKIFINDIEVVGIGFLWDGCHKIYILESEEDKQHAIKESGYNKKDVYPLERLEEIYEESCSLRFIENYNLDKIYVRQFEVARFQYREDE